MFIYNLLINLLFPKKCPFCNKIISADSNECGECDIYNLYTDMTPIYPLGTDTKSKNKRYFYCAVAAFYYKNEIRNAITSLKFKRRKHCADVLAQYMAKLMDKVNYFNSIDYICAVPISRERLEKRGYNQSELIAKYICDYSGYEYREFLFKVKDNLPQSKTKNSKERNKNVIGCYKTVNTDIIKGTTILLIDDVITTSSTVNECSKVLLEAGADKVIVFACAVAGANKKSKKYKSVL